MSKDDGEESLKRQSTFKTLAGGISKLVTAIFRMVCKKKDPKKSG